MLGKVSRKNFLGRSCSLFIRFLSQTATDILQFECRMTLEQERHSHPVPSRESHFGEPVDINLGSSYAIQLGFDGVQAYQAGTAQQPLGTEPESKKKKKKKRKKKK